MFAITVAPARAASAAGGTGTHMSSQISTARTKPGRSRAENSRSAPNGASCPATAISPVTSSPEARVRAS